MANVNCPVLVWKQTEFLALKFNQISSAGCLNDIVGFNKGIPGCCCHEPIAKDERHDDFKESTKHLYL
jgi:hypothetical protein